VAAMAAVADEGSQNPPFVLDLRLGDGSGSHRSQNPKTKQECSLLGLGSSAGRQCAVRTPKRAWMLISVLAAGRRQAGPQNKQSCSASQLGGWWWQPENVGIPKMSTMCLFSGYGRLVVGQQYVEKFIYIYI